MHLLWSESEIEENCRRKRRDLVEGVCVCVYRNIYCTGEVWSSSGHGVRDSGFRAQMFWGRAF